MAQVQLELEEADGNLPPICMKCGEPSTTTVTRHMSWCPPWVAVLIVVGLLPYAIVAIILTKRARVGVPLCDQHKGHWLYRNLLIWVTFVLLGMISAGAFGLAIVLDPDGKTAAIPFSCFAGLGFFLLWVVMVVVVQMTAIRPQEITDHHIRLQGVGEAFVDAIEEADQERRARRRRRSRDWDDDDDLDELPIPKKNRTPKSEGIEEPRRRRRRDDASEE